MSANNILAIAMWRITAWHAGKYEKEAFGVERVTNPRQVKETQFCVIKGENAIA